MNQRNFRGGWGFDGHIFQKIISIENLLLAWREFRRGKGNKKETQEFEFNLEENLSELRIDLTNQTYKPLPYTSFFVFDPKKRHIHKANIRDRVLHQAVFRILNPIFDKYFIYDSYASRFEKGVHAAVYRLESFLNKASLNNKFNAFALKCDIRKFFDSIDHKILAGIIKERINDDGTLWLLEKIIGSFEKQNGKGLPLGNVTSQLFGNIYLNELDQFVKRQLKQKCYIRYCDDFVFLNRSKGELLKLIPTIQNFLSVRLDLQLHEGKIEIRKHIQGTDFLGYISRPYSKILRTKTKRRLLRKINQNNLDSYMGILKHCDGCDIKAGIFVRMFDKFFWMRI